MTRHVKNQEYVTHKERKISKQSKHRNKILELLEKGLLNRYYMQDAQGFKEKYEHKGEIWEI